MSVAIKISEHLSGTFRCETEGKGVSVPAQPHALSIQLPGTAKTSYHGLISRQNQAPNGAMTLELRPWFHFLKKGTGCRVFQDKTVPEIFTAVATETGYGSYIKNSLNSTYPKLEYAVQYNESDYNFLSRLMEEAGISYYFTSAKNRHTMVLADSTEGYAEGPELSWLGENFPETPDAFIWNVGLVQTAQTAKVTLDDHNYLTPAANLTATSGNGNPSITEFGSGHSVQADGENIAGLRLDAFESAALELVAETSHSGLSAGMIFTLKGHPEASFNKKWLITSLEMSMDENGHCRVQLRARPGDKVFRPLCVHPRPRVYGPLTGVVCGKSGEKIWTDEHGRIKVRFHWDHKTPADETASVWLRVVQPWAGKTHGAMFLPRVGDEVLINFLSGDPDRPIVTGSIYNAAAKTHWPLPDNKTVTGLKDDGANEMLLDDKKDNERIYFHAQKLLELLAEDERRVIIKGEGGDSLVLEKGPRVVDVKKGDDSLKVAGKRTVTIEGDETQQNKKNLDLKVDGNYTLTVKGDLKIKAKSITLESDAALTAKSGTAMKINAGTTLEISAGSTAKLAAKTGATIDGGAQFKLAASAKGEVNGGGMLDVKGGLLKLN